MCYSSYCGSDLVPMVRSAHVPSLKKIQSSCPNNFVSGTPSVHWDTVIFGTRSCYISVTRYSCRRDRNILRR